MANVQTIQSTPVTEAGAAIKRVPVEVLNLQWVYCHYPMAWTYVDGEWLPELTQLSFRKGLNGQADDGDFRAPKMHAVAKGATLIEPNHPKLGKHRGYLVTVPGIIANTGAVGKYYCSKWESPTVLGARNVSWKSDIKGYREFLRHLIDSGIIEPVSRVAVESKISSISYNIEQLQSQPVNQFRQANIDRMSKLVEEMTASLDEIEEPFEPEEISIESEEDAPKKLTGKPRKGN